MSDTGIPSSTSSNHSLPVVPRRWLLLRGLTRGQRHWGDFPQRLQQAFPESEVISVDLPGNGQYRQQVSPLNVHHMMQFVRGKVQQETHQPPLHILSLSMGGMVAMEWLKCYPDDCAAAVLMNSSFSGVSRFYQRLQPSSYLYILRFIFSLNTCEREKIIFRLTSNQAICKTTLRRWLEIAQSEPVGRRNSLRQLYAAASYTLPADKPDKPLLLLCSEHDRLVNAACSSALAQKWSLPMAVHQQAGHDLPLDAADWVCDQLVQWCANHSV